MKRLKYENIKHVALLSYNDCIYEVFVSFGNYVSDSRCYSAGIEKVSDNTYHPHPIAFETLPKCVTKFIREHEPQTTTPYKVDDGFCKVRYTKDRPKMEVH